MTADRDRRRGRVAGRAAPAVSRTAVPDAHEERPRWLTSAFDPARRRRSRGAASCSRSAWRSTPSPRRCSPSRWSASSLSPARRLARAGLDLARPGRRLPRGPDAARDLPEPVRRAVGRRDGERSLLGAPHRRRDSSRCSPSTARTSAARCAGSPSRGSSCARATAASTTTTARAPPGRRRAGLYRVRVQDRERRALGARRRSCRRWRSRCEACSATIGAWLDAARRARRADRARPATHPVPRELGELVVRLRQRARWSLRPADRHRHLPRDRLRAVGERGVDEPRVAQLRAAARLVPARAARLGLELHGRADDACTWSRCSCSAPSSIRASSPGWSASCCSCCTLGMAFTGQVMRFDQDAYWGLGIGASIAGRTPVIGAAARPPHARRADHRAARRCRASSRCTSSSFPACSSALVGLHLLPGAEARHQRVADAGRAGEPRDVPPTSTKSSSHATACRSCPTRRSKDLVFAGLVILSLWSRARRSSARSGPNGQPDPTHHRDRAAAGLLLPVALRGVRAAAAVHRDVAAC